MIRKIAASFLSTATLCHAVHIIRILDDQTSRGVPLVELQTTNHIKFISDSAGIIAFDEPGLLGTKVWFDIRSSGYDCHAAGIDTIDGKTTELKIHRANIAERLYRVTGQGIYRDSVLANLPVPIQHPLLNAQVMGQDSVQCIQYHDKLWWFWGDTARSGAPLGQFATSGATSDLPTQGGLDPSLGVNLEYFVGPTGFSRPMIDDTRSGVKWADGLMVLKDDAGHDRLIGHYAHLKDFGHLLDRSLMLFDDEKNIFHKWIEFDKNETLAPAGQPLRVTLPDGDYFYFPAPYAITRVRATWTAVQDLHQYEAYTPLKPGTRYSKDHPQLDRDPAGKLLWAWKKNTGPIRQNDERDLLKSGLIKPSETFYNLKDIDTQKPVSVHGGSVCWNPYRQKYIMIFVEVFGTSMLGEVWFTESSNPQGPFTLAKKIATHDHMDFYNPVQHPFFDQQGGQIIYFEGTYTNSFSGNPNPTPRYNYNQLMYRLDLSDPRLKLDPK